MPTSCVVSGCNSRGTIKGVSYFRFPANEELRQKWVIAVKRIGWTPTEHSRVCSNHFDAADFDRSMLRLRLREGSVPCIFPAFFKVKVESCEDEIAQNEFESILCPKIEIETEEETKVENDNEVFAEEFHSVLCQKMEINSEETIKEKNNEVHAPKCCECPAAKKLEMKLFKTNLTVKKQKLKIRTLQQNKRRLKRRVARLEDTIDALKKKLEIDSSRSSINKSSENV